MKTRFFYYLLAVATMAIGVLLVCLAERVTRGVGTSLLQGHVPTGLAYLYRFRYCLLIVPLLMFALGMLSARATLLRTPVAMAIVAISAFSIFFFGALMLATPVIAMLPID